MSVPNAQDLSHASFLFSLLSSPCPSLLRTALKFHFLFFSWLVCTTFLFSSFPFIALTQRMDFQIEGVGLGRSKITAGKAKKVVAPSPLQSSSDAASDPKRRVRVSSAPATDARRTSSAKKTDAGAHTKSAPTTVSADAVLEKSLVENLKRQIRLLEQHVTLLKGKGAALPPTIAPETDAASCECHSAVPHEGHGEPSVNVRLSAMDAMIAPPVVSTLASTAIQRAIPPEPHQTEISALEVNLRALVTECAGLQDMCGYLNREKEVMGHEIVELRAALRESQLESHTRELLRDAALDQLSKEQSARRALEHAHAVDASATAGAALPPSLEDVTHQRDFFKIQAERLRTTATQQTAELDAMRAALQEERRITKENEEQLCVCMDRLELIEARSTAAREYYTQLSRQFVVLASVVRNVMASNKDKEAFAEALDEVQNWQDAVASAPALPEESFAPEPDVQAPLTEAEEEPSNAAPAPFERTDKPSPARYPTPPESPTQVATAEVAEESPVPEPEAPSTVPAEESATGVVETPVPGVAAVPTSETVDVPVPEETEVADTAEVPAPETAEVVEVAAPEAPDVPVPHAIDAPSSVAAEAAAPEDVEAPVPEVVEVVEAVDAVGAAAPEAADVPAAEPAEPPTPVPEAPAVPISSPPPANCVPPPPSVPVPAPPALSVPIPAPPPASAIPLPPASSVPLPPMAAVPVPAAMPVPTTGGSTVPVPPAPPTLKERLSALDAQAAEEEAALAQFVRDHTTA